VILQRSLIKYEGKQSTLAIAVGGDVKGKVSILLCAVAIPLAFVKPLLSCGLYVAVAITWLIPDRRIERVLAKSERATD
jgi:hypothetical protein